MGCGRIGFGLIESDAASASDSNLNDNSLFISPTGSDQGDGSHDAPYRTFSFALSKLSPGRTLMAMPGMYGVSSGTGTMHIDCRPTGVACDGAQCPSGSAGAPIVIRALEERSAQVVAEPGMSVESINIQGCSHYQIEGFTVIGIDNADAGSANVKVHDSSSISLRRNLLARSNRMVKAHLLDLVHSTDVLVEENEFYDFHRTAVLSWRSTNVTARRNYVNARMNTDLSDGDMSIYPTSGDIAFACHHSARCVFENNISEGGTMKGMSIIASQLEQSIPGAGDDVGVLGNIVIGTAEQGTYVASGCAGAINCTGPVVVSRLLVRDNLYLNNLGRSLFVRGATEAVIDHNSSLGHHIRIDLHNDNINLDASVTITNTLRSSPRGPWGHRSPTRHVGNRLL